MSSNKLVAEFSPATTPVERSLDYPGARPEGSFITDGHEIVELPTDHDQFWEEANGILAAQKLPALEERTPVLAYGANANPVKLRDKMAKYGNGADHLMQTVPHTLATLPGQLAVWHGRPAQNGGIFAELYQPEDPDEAAKVQLRAHVAYLTPEQLSALHISEGVTYSAAELPALLGTAKSAEAAPVLAYVALKASVLLKDDRPILVKGLANTAEGMASMTSEEAVAYMLDTVSAEFGQVAPRDFIDEGHSMKLAAKKVRQERVRELLTARGASRPYAFPAEEGVLIGRADFSSLPGRRNHSMILMPEMVLTAIRPSGETIDDLVARELQKSPDAAIDDVRKKLHDKHDPARQIARRAHDELEVRLEMNPPEATPDSLAKD